MSNVIKNDSYPEISGYNIINDDDPDILNQRSIDHIKKYLLSIDKDTSIIIPSNKYSINSLSFFIKIIFFILFIWILSDFINLK